MKAFLFKLALFAAPVFMGIVVLLAAADGYADASYVRFTTPRQSSMILGISRAAQGIQPKILDNELHRNDFFNYAFSRGESPYGPTYLNSIKKKLDTRTKNGVFILTVDAWTISSDTKKPDDSIHFEELHSCLAQTKNVNAKPNIPYLLHSYSRFYSMLLRKNKNMFLHDDGWLEITVPMDSISVAANLNQKIGDYKTDILPHYHFSALRYSYLGKTIRYLSQFGKVYLVRLPVHPKMMEIDEALVPNSNRLFEAIAKEYGVPYLDFASKNDHYQYVDGNHLYKKSGEKVTREIAAWIASQPH